MNLKGKVALITGGARMGEAIATRLARHGCHIAVSYRASKRPAQRVVESVMPLHVQGATFQADLSREGDHARLIKAVVNTFGRLDLVINMASRYAKTPLAKLNAKEWGFQLDADLRSGYLLALAARSELAKHGSGRIVLISDWIAASGRPRYKDYLPYYVAKRGVIGLIEGLALELAPKILVNAIAPGPTLPPPGMSKREIRETAKNTPLQRWGGADEIAKAVEFLGTSDYVTGETIRVDGGRHLY